MDQRSQNNNGTDLGSGLSSQKSAFVSSPSVSLPKGGGAIHGMGEKFAANPVTGTGSMSIPIAISPGRSGFGPQLSLSYDSGAGNGPFGLGWNLSLPSITRKTDKGLPKYQDADESDVFILSGAEDLVPVLIENGGAWERELIPPRTVENKTYLIQRYRPRIEGLFARIERWSNQTDLTDTFWRSITQDNITTWYGKTAESRIADPADPAHIFSWLICENYDDKGNAIAYQYAEENSDGIDLSQAHEQNRSLNTRKANRYLKTIQYGNLNPYLPVLTETGTWPNLPGNNGWLFEVVFDYGEHDTNNPLPNEFVTDWPARNDPFSSYRAGFEVRSYRLCQRVLMFHHFPDEQGVGQNCLVHSTDFTYSYEQDPTSVQNPVFSFLLKVTQTGYKRNDNGGYLSKSLPPVEFEYSRAIIDETLQEVDPKSLENLPYGLDGSNYQWIDLDGEGLSGILTEQAEGWYYKRNISANQQVIDPDTNATRTVARFNPIELVTAKTNSTLTAGRAQFMDLAGDGQADLVVMEATARGFYERTADEDWEPFQAFESWPDINTRDPNLKFIDLTGDGHADILISEDQVFIWHASLAESGYGAAQRVQQQFDEEKGPHLVFADGVQSIYLADMSGDGLTDIVRVRNGEVSYWPNVGYCRFGTKVNMDNAPWFDNTDSFDQRRIHLVDIDGSGVTDILYLGSTGVQIYFNQSGNSWSSKRLLTRFPHIDNVSSVETVDLLGNGTACLVWSSALPGNVRQPMRYIDLMGGQKPHLLIKIVNNLGAETMVQYAPSTKFYLQDKLADKPWITKLPFPVHVVERVETRDHISGNRFVSRHAYHHGYFDGVEREFRGFGMVEQWDTEEFTVLTADETSSATNFDGAFHVPPILTKTWFHTGAFIDHDRISNFFTKLLPEQGGYYREPGLTQAQAEQLLLDDTVLPSGLTAEEEREACRSLKGAMLRQEIYALDGTDKQPHPYSVAELNYTIDSVQPFGQNQHAVFFTHARESLSYHYERNPVDPRISHEMVLEVDQFGHVLKSVAIAYPRRTPLHPEQGLIHAAYTENRITNKPNATDWYRLGLPVETLTFEITGLPGTSQRFTIADFYDKDAASQISGFVTAPEITYEQIPDNTLQKRLIERIRTLYRSNSQANTLDPTPLPLGEAESLALPYESYKMAFTPGLLTQVYGSKISTAELVNVLQNEGKYLERDGMWWIPSGRQAFDPGRFYIPTQIKDPFGGISTMLYDNYALMVIESRDALPAPLTNVVKVRNNYRTMQPEQITDPNGNRAQVAFDALGMVAGTAVMGKETEAKGDSLDGFNPDLAQPEIDSFLANPLGMAVSLLGNATTRIIYDLERFTADRQPVVAATIVRETHVSDLAAGAQPKVQVSFSYSDGFGREVQKKIQAEPGDAPQRESNATNPIRPGKLILENGKLKLDAASPRWVGNGRIIFNNKGKPVKQYEPFFSSTHLYEDEPEMVMTGVTPILFYDPAERVVATLHPNHTYQKVVFDPWQQVTWDVNDTVLLDPKTDPDVGGFFRRLPDADFLPTWYTQRQGGALGSQEQEAANKTAIHANTPTIAHADTLGRTFFTVAHNKFKYSTSPPSDPPIEEFQQTRVILDIEGNQREVIDAKDRIVMGYDYDMLGNRIHQASMEAGERWMLNDVRGNPLYAWDSRDHQFRTRYDLLRRPVETFLREGAGTERIIGRTVYGETHPNPEANNLRGKVVQLFDQAGLVTSDDYDFKGNLLQSQRQLAREYKATLDWSTNVPLEPEVYTSSTRYNALNRPTEQIAPDNSIYRPTYNEANLLEKVDVNLRGATATTPFITDIDYDAKGQRTLIDYGNGVTTTYEYDPLTFRLTRLTTTRSAGLNGLAAQLFKDAGTVQDMTYTYDPVGNITRVADDALPTLIFANQQVDPVGLYTYDAVYRLIEAQGRESIGQSALQLGLSQATYRDYPYAGLGSQPFDPKAVRNYTEQYHYDEVGNFLRMIHHAQGGDWVRGYHYEEDSLIEPGKFSNRLRRTVLHPNGNQSIIEPYIHDAHGNMIAMPHLTLMQWDFKDQLQATARQVVNDGTPETTFYVYDASGQRVRKVTERPNGTRKSERIYLGGFEMYREYGGNGTGVSLERESLHVMDDKQRIALVETRTQGADDSPTQLVRYQLGNHLGSASLEVDDAGQLISYEEYHPYGSTSYQAGRSAAEVSLKRYRFTAMERDEETGLNYHGARYYAPWLARWLSADPIGLADGTNLYRYVRNNPVVLVDPAGTDSGHMRYQPISVDDVPQPVDGHLVNSPTRQTKNLSRVTVNDLDAQRTTVTTMDAVRSSPDYVDNEIVSAGAEVSDLMYLNVTALNLRYTNKQDALIPVGAIDFQNKVPSYEFLKSNGVIYPVSPDGNIALNELNTPTILKYAEMKQRDRSQALTTREEYGWIVYAFSESIKRLGHAASSVPTARFRTGQLVTRSREIGAGSGGQSPFNPSGSRQNCVNCTSAFLNSVRQKQLVTASRDVARNLGGIANANKQIEAETGAVLGQGQYRTLNTGRPLQFFVVYPGSSTTTASHVLIGINNQGRTMIYDPQSHEKFFDISSFGRFTAYPVAFPNGD
ncbi:MAG: SpvB/TcaC N-terminal domain-containing protein [Methylobacter sp.]